MNKEWTTTFVNEVGQDWRRTKKIKYIAGELYTNEKKIIHKALRSRQIRRYKYIYMYIISPEYQEGDDSNL